MAYSSASQSYYDPVSMLHNQIVPMTPDFESIQFSHQQEVPYLAVAYSPAYPQTYHRSQSPLQQVPHLPQGYYTSPPSMTVHASVYSTIDPATAALYQHIQQQELMNQIDDETIDRYRYESMGSRGEEYRGTRQDYRQGREGYNQRLDYYSQGIENYSQGLENYSQGIENYSQRLETYSQGLENYSQGLENYSQGIQDYSQVREDYSQGIEDYSQVGEDYSQVIENYSHVGEDYGQGREDYSQAREDYSQERENYSQEGADNNEHLSSQVCDTHDPSRDDYASRITAPQAPASHETSQDEYVASTGNSYSTAYDSPIVNAQITQQPPTRANCVSLSVPPDTLPERNVAVDNGLSVEGNGPGYHVSKRCVSLACHQVHPSVDRVVGTRSRPASPQAAALPGQSAGLEGNRTSRQAQVSAYDKRCPVNNDAPSSKAPITGTKSDSKKRLRSGQATNVNGEMSQSPKSTYNSVKKSQSSRFTYGSLKKVQSSDCSLKMSQSSRSNGSAKKMEAANTNHCAKKMKSSKATVCVESEDEEYVAPHVPPPAPPNIATPQHRRCVVYRRLVQGEAGAFVLEPLGKATFIRFAET